MIADYYDDTKNLKQGDGTYNTKLKFRASIRCPVAKPPWPSAGPWTSL